MLGLDLSPQPRGHFPKRHRGIELCSSLPPQIRIKKHCLLLEKINTLTLSSPGKSHRYDIHHRGFPEVTAVHPAVGIGDIPEVKEVLTDAGWTAEMNPMT